MSKGLFVHFGSGRLTFVTGDINVCDSCLRVYASFYGSRFKHTEYLEIAGNAERVCPSIDFYDHFHEYGGVYRHLVFRHSSWQGGLFKYTGWLIFFIFLGLFGSVLCFLFYIRKLA